ncbi:lactonase family protein [Luedemannella flava]|uniref:Lactonase family protein n=1 Tax=Luedemannella flava TaxID=349316 RepID=A0ABP4YNT4_9ACTN
MSTGHVYVGCYTTGAGGEGTGIMLARRDLRTGELEEPVTVATTPAPSYLVTHPSLSVLYAVDEREVGAVAAFVIGDDLGLTPLGHDLTGGSLPCHLAVTPDGRHLLTANYGDGSVTVHRLGPDGALAGRTAHHVLGAGSKVDAERQAGPHAHEIVIEPDGLLRVVDLGGDAVYALRLADGVPTEVDSIPVRPGTGPRHLVAADGYVYVCGELDASVTVFAADAATGAWREHDRVAAGTDKGALSEILLSADGRFLYVASRGPDTIATFALRDGHPTLVGEVGTGGSWPRQVTRAGDLLYVANERSHTVVVFRLDAATGLPAPTGCVRHVPSPTCVHVMS